LTLILYLVYQFGNKEQSMQRANQGVRDYILEGIEAGRFGPGVRLPTERALCETLSVTRTAVRNALAVLEGEGRVVRAPGSGTFVADIPPNAPARSNDIASSPAQVMEARLAFEPQMAHLVVANGTASDFARFQECVERGGSAERMEDFEYWDAALHEAIAEAARNPLIVAAYGLITQAREQGEWGDLKRRSLTDERRAHYQAEHERIVAALRRRDAQQAEEEIRAHLIRVRSNLLGI
jgi:DNA-binding FadR family transcriptional regulator